MKFVEWCELFVIGHPRIDQQHQELFRICNEFYSHIHKGSNRRLVKSTLNHLIAYAEEHFSTEEKLSERFSYPVKRRERHKQIHAHLMEQIFELNNDIEGGRISGLRQIEDFLTNWLVMHILIEDKKYRKHLKL